MHHPFKPCSSTLRTALACAALALGLAAPAQAETINFDELDCGYSNTRPTASYDLGNGYKRLNWGLIACTNQSALGPWFSTQFNDSGYNHGVHTQRNLAAVLFDVGPHRMDLVANPRAWLSGTVSAPSGYSFDFNSLYMAPAWIDGLVVDIEGFRDGSSTPVYTKTVTLRAGVPAQFVDLQFKRVHSVKFTSRTDSGNYYAPYFKYPAHLNPTIGQIFTMDTLEVEIYPPQPVPTSSPLALLALSGLVAATGGALRRRRAQGRR